MTLLNISDGWTIAGTLFTILVSITTGVYTIITFSIFQQNKNANQLSAYLTLKKELTSDAFIYCTRFCRQNKIKIDLDNTITEICGYKIDNGELTINALAFLRDVLGHIEDLALFEEKKILTIDLIDAGYGYSLLHIGSNNEVRSLIRNLRDGSCVYNGFGNLYLAIYKKLNYVENKKFRTNLFEV